MVLPPSGSNQSPPRPSPDQDDWLALIVALGTVSGLFGWLFTAGLPVLQGSLSSTVSSAGRQVVQPAAKVRVIETLPQNPDVSPADATDFDIANNGQIEEWMESDRLTVDTLPPNPLPIGEIALPPPPPTLAERSDPTAPLTVPEPQIPHSSNQDTLPIIRPPLAFTDVASDYWAKPYIDALTARGVLNGLPEGVFEPYRPMSRAELAAQVAKAFNLKPSIATKSFIDVAPDYWAQTTIQEAVTTGFMTGYPEGIFRPNDTIPRLQVLVAIASGLSLPPPNAPAVQLQVYQDQAEIPNWARKQVAAAIAADIVTPSPLTDNQLRPNDPVTRAEVAVLIYRTLVYMGKVEPLQ